MGQKVRIIGGGMAGTEAAWQCLNAGCEVTLYEMRPVKMTEAHTGSNLAELVCSNSFKSEDPASASGMLKSEMRELNSLLMAAAEKARVPAGQALAVDRIELSKAIESALFQFPQFKIVREEVKSLPTHEELERQDELLIVATGPLTAPALASDLRLLCGGGEYLYFYDAIAPIVDADSIDPNIAFRGDRYGAEGEQGDYLNIAFSKEEYLAFVEAVQAAEKMPLHEFEKPKYFESCLPIEVMIDRGIDTLRFGPMKPVGFDDPRTGRRPYALLQFRPETKDRTMFSMVGFQTKMKWPEQKRVFSQFIPGMAEAEFLRFGSVHRNTYVCGPRVLNPDLSLREHPRIFLAGQITGVEGYTESAAMGLIAGRAASAKANSSSFFSPPRFTVIGALLDYVTAGPSDNFQPMNTNLGLLPALDLERKVPKAMKKTLYHDRQQSALADYLRQIRTVN